MKHIILIIIIAAGAIGIIAWFQKKPTDVSRVSVTRGTTQDFMQETEAIIIENTENDFQVIDADIQKL